MATNSHSVSPRDVAVLCEIIAEAHERGQNLELRGGGSKTEIGKPQSADIIVDMRNLSAISAYDPAELVLTAEAGTPVTVIEALLKENGQMLAFEPGDYGPLFGAASGRSTIGGVLSCNLSGPRRISAGAARDHFLGFDAVSGRGIAFKAGGPVIKNVTGYDLPKLLAGAWGTLAALTSVTLKVMPRPRAAFTLVVSGLSDDEAVRTMSHCMAGPVSISGACHLPPGLLRRAPEALTVPRLHAITAFRLEGFEASVKARAQGLRHLLADIGPVEILAQDQTEYFWSYIRDVGPFINDLRTLWRVSVPPAQGAHVMHALKGQDVEAFYDWSGALIWLAISQDSQGSHDTLSVLIRRAAKSAGGHAMLMRAAPELRRRIDIFDPRAAPLAEISARVKTAFDPRGIFSPHRFAQVPSGAPSLAGAG